MDFSWRPASTGWETLVLVPGTPIGMWVWCKPVHAPFDLIVRVPAETIQAYGGLLTLRQIATAAGIEMFQLQRVALSGTYFDAPGGMSPLLDQVVPPAAPWVEISFRMAGMAGQAAPTPAVVGVPLTNTGPAVSSRQTQATAMAIESDWSGILGIEGQLSGLRKQLATLQGKLQTLNRDLSSDENVAADNQDKREWQDARRWLRDSSSLASRYIKEADAGVSSMAGSKRRMEQMVTEARSGRLTPQQMASTQNEIESYRKTILNIQTQMQNAIQSASRDGEQRAQQILTRIAAKVRNHRTKR